MFLTLNRGTFYTFLILATFVSYQVAFSSVYPEQEGPSTDPQQEELEPASESDSVDTQEGNSFSSETLFENTTQNDETGNLNDPEGDSFYEADEDEDNSQSVISFNFLYYLLQKFKFSDSLLY
jgi:cytoskeletal protein RodZ